MTSFKRIHTKGEKRRERERERVRKRKMYN
jgi:hypothetical protein